MKIFNWILFLSSIAGILFSIALIIMGNTPCSGDGCIIHILYIAGTILFVISLIIFIISKRAINKYKEKEKLQNEATL